MTPEEANGFERLAAGLSFAAEHVKQLPTYAQQQLSAAQLTIRTLTNVIEQAEAHVEDRDQRLGNLAADLLEERSQRAFLEKKLGEAEEQVEALRSERDKAIEDLAAHVDRLVGDGWDRVALTFERDEARADRDRLADELAQAKATIVRLTAEVDRG